MQKLALSTTCQQFVTRSRGSAALAMPWLCTPIDAIAVMSTTRRSDTEGLLYKGNCLGNHCRKVRACDLDRLLSTRIVPWAAIVAQRRTPPTERSGLSSRTLQRFERSSNAMRQQVTSDARRRTLQVPDCILQPTRLRLRCRAGRIYSGRGVLMVRRFSLRRTMHACEVAERRRSELLSCRRVDRASITRSTLKGMISAARNRLGGSSCLRAA
jgi:hypothetical protein